MVNSDVAMGKCEVGPPRAETSGVLPASEGAAQQWAQVNLGDKRLNRRALEMGAKMAAKPEASLPSQMESRKALRGAYLVLNNPRVSLEALLAPHIRQT